MFSTVWNNLGGNGGYEGLLEESSWVGSSMNELKGVLRVPLYGIKSSTLNVQLLQKSGGRSTT